jgi:hypothetical protein
MSKIEIVNPLSKSEYKTFLNQFIQIHFYSPSNKEKDSLEDLKNLIFPPDTTDEVFNNLIDFVTKIMDYMIKTVKDSDMIKNEIENEFIFEEDTFNQIDLIIQSKRNGIIDFLNKEFMSENMNKLKKINWSTKMILSGNSDNYYNGKYADIEFSYNNNTNVIKHKNITFTKNDIDKVMKEFETIKLNLEKIKQIE